GDITRSQRYRVQLEEAKNFAETLLASREQFMAAITHDLRSPLTTVMGYTDLIQKTDLDEKQAYYLKQIKKSSEFILRLVNDLLDLSKLEAGKMLIEKLAFHPGKLIEDTVNNIIPAERTKNVTIEIVVAPEAQMQLVSDPFRIKQILANLISNAWKFTEEGSIVISANLVKPKKNKEILELRVKDSGIGISKEKQDSIFEEFSQEDNSIEKKFGGTGLGLAITKRLAHLLEGDIRVESEPGMGSEFIIEIPVEKYQLSGKKSSDQIIEKNYAASGLKALVVDDEPGQLSLTVELSRSMGFEIDTAANGKIALEKISQKDYDLILTDIQMPVLDGFELIKTIRGTDEIMHLPVIALSGRTDLEKQVYMDAGFDEKLLKPYKSATLKDTIAEVLDLEHKETVSSNVQGESTELQTGLYDLSEIYEFAGKDDDAFKEILRAFIEGTKESMVQLKSAWESRNEDELGKTAHRMLPMLRQMQAHTITPDLQKLEERKNINETEFVSLEVKLEQLINDIEAKIKA
ncbi:hybrid sensor histidine kinase/response regulator, partial [Christiangramia sp. ASW11-125]|uniref:hybrid sensor histidine kinase/response regulator n=1 Tax=Christiangramia sp. ASW11-125 TaxID=3400701 RepID=UPI003AAE3ADB